MSAVSELLREPADAAAGAAAGGAAGYIDLLGDRPSGADTRAQRAMTSWALPLIYERLWRPLGVRLALSLFGVGTSVEEQMTYELLAPQPGDKVLDVACGPVNVTRRLLGWVGDKGTVVGVDASPTMLARAVRDTAAPNVAYLRADAQRLPFRDEAFDVVCCYAALYLIEDPFAAIDELIRVLAPGGRLAVLASCHRGPEPFRHVATAFTAPGGVRVFGRAELTDAFRAGGLVDVRRRVTGVAQFVGGRKQGPPAPPA